MEIFVRKRDNIYIILVGGLGNQLFLYAFGRGIAEQRNGQLVLDTSFFRSDQYSVAKDGSLRTYGLDTLLARATPAGPGARWMLALARKCSRSPFLTALWNHTVGYAGPRLVVDTLDSTKLEGLPDYGSLILEGYWQSYHHFQRLRPALLEELKPRDMALRAAQQSYVDQVRAASNVTGEVISLHVRRGDYVTADVGLVVQPVADIERRIAQFDTQTPIIVFSDDPDWCEAHFNTPRFHIRRGYSAVADLYAMSLCDHNIIANSSLGWWGAWLNQNPNKRVIVPNSWFVGDFPNWQERLVLPGWEIV